VLPIKKVNAQIHHKYANDTLLNDDPP